MEQDFDIKHWTNPCPKYDCRKNACKCGLKYVSIPAALGDDSAGSEVAPKNGAYCNAIVKYEANGNIYMYSKEGIPVLINSVTCDCPEEEIINLSVVIDENSWGTPRRAYEVGYIIGISTLSPAQGNPGLFVNDDSGEFVTEKEAYELVASGKKVKFNHVPVGQFLTPPHISGLGPDYVNGVELANEFVTNIDGAPINTYSATVSFALGETLAGDIPPLGVFFRKIGQEPYDDAYEFIVQGVMYEEDN